MLEKVIEYNSQDINLLERVLWKFTDSVYLLDVAVLNLISGMGNSTSPSSFTGILFFFI